MGIVGRDHKGQVLFVKAISLEAASSPSEVEGKAILLGMKEAQKRGWSKVTFSTDNMRVCFAVLDKEGTCHKENDWRTECQKMITLFEDWSIEHVFREANPKFCRKSPNSQSGNVIEILKERSFLESFTSEELKSACVKSNLKVYCGFDPTAESLHLGNLLGIIVLSWFQRCGHTPVELIGSATARIGDPSGKSLERPELDVETLERNTVGIRETISKILKNNNAEDGGFVVLNNYDWWKDMRLLDFLKRVGQYARVGTMMAKESVKKRLESEQGMSSNRISQAEGAYGLTFPLLLKTDGTKFGKFADGAIWLSPSMLSPYKFYHYFFSVLVADVEVTQFVHGQDGLDEAIKATEALRPGAATALDWRAIDAIAQDASRAHLPMVKF
ncbi:hypothetical protein QQ045_005673 [Rhodiola kirilowii]